MNNALQAHEEPVRLKTALADEVAARRTQPTSQIADMITGGRENLEHWRRQREKIQAIQTVKMEETNTAYLKREEIRQETLAALRAEMAKITDIGIQDASDVRDRLKSIDIQSVEQIKALDKLINAQENLVRDLSR